MNRILGLLILTITLATSYFNTQAQCSLPTIPPTAYHPADGEALDYSTVWGPPLNGVVVIDAGKTVTIINGTNIYKGTLINYGTVNGTHLSLTDSARWYNTISGRIDASSTFDVNGDGPMFINQGFLKTGLLKTCCAPSICLGQDSRTIANDIYFNSANPIVLASGATYAFIKVYNSVTTTSGGGLTTSSNVNICNASSSSLDTTTTGSATVTAPLCTAPESASSLPLNLISFDVQQENGLALIQWKTNASGICFLQYSQDGVVFSNIAEGKNGSFTYQLTSGLNLFRLKSIDHSTEYSPIRQLKYDAQVLEDASDNIQLFDLMGKKLDRIPTQGFYIQKKGGVVTKHAVVQ